MFSHRDLITNHAMAAYRISAFCRHFLADCGLSYGRLGSIFKLLLLSGVAMNQGRPDLASQIRIGALRPLTQLHSSTMPKKKLSLLPGA